MTFRILINCLFYTSLIILGILVSCTSVKPQKHKNNKFDDDLTKFRTNYQFTDTLNKTADINKFKDTTIVPENDINNSLDSIIRYITENYKNSKAPIYRVQVYSNKNREMAKQAKLIVYKKFLDIDVYTTYHQPNIRVRVGNFINRLDAYRIYVALKSDFNNILIVQDKIKISKIK